MSKKLKALVGLPILCLLSGCATGISGIDSGCRSFKPIAASKADTTSTKRQVIGHNRAYDAICERNNKLAMGN